MTFSDIHIDSVSAAHIFPNDTPVSPGDIFNVVFNCKYYKANDFYTRLE